MIQNPHLLPKVRSPALMQAMSQMPCCLRITSFIPGRRCSGQDTVVGAHLPTIGKGMGSKVTDLAVVAACHSCHDLIDGRDSAGRDFIMTTYPTAVVTRMLDGLVETHARLIGLGYSFGADWEII